MLEEMQVITDREERLSAAVGAEFPSLFISFAHDGSPHLRASEWERPDFDTWDFDVRLDELAREPFTLRVADDRVVPASAPAALAASRRPPQRRDGAAPAGVDAGTTFALQVLNRCQRLIGRRNRHSQTKLFDRVLRRHAGMHDTARPLVRADYNHALDVWQWALRLDGNASLELQLAALFHDVERLVSEADVRVEHLADDYQRFKDAHAVAGAAITGDALRECGAGERTCSRVAELIAAHERPSATDAEVALLNDADALSFFSLNSSGYADYFGPAQTAKKVAYTLARMRPAARARLASVRLRPDVAALVR
jgi:hypothetical protein